MTGAAPADDPFAAFRAAVARRDDAAALDALRRAFAPADGREAALRGGLAVAEDEARIDLWLAAARDVAHAAPDDAFAHYVTGWVLQRQKLLGDAEPYLARAAALAPQVGDYVDAYAWNALLRFDRPEAARRATLGEFAGKEAFLADANRTETGSPAVGAAIGFAVAALATTLATLYLKRALRAPD